MKKLSFLNPAIFNKSIRYLLFVMVTMLLVACDDQDKNLVGPFLVYNSIKVVSSDGVNLLSILEEDNILKVNMTMNVNGHEYKLREWHENVQFKIGEYSLEDGTKVPALLLIVTSDVMDKVNLIALTIGSKTYDIYFNESRMNLIYEGKEYSYPEVLTLVY